MASVKQQFVDCVTDLGKILETHLKIEGGFTLDYTAQVAEAILSFDKFTLIGPLWLHVKENKYFSEDSAVRITRKMADHLFGGSDDSSTNTSPDSAFKKVVKPPVSIDGSTAVANLKDAMDAAAELLPERKESPFEADGNPMDQLQVHAEHDASNTNLAKQGLITCQDLVKVTADGWEYLLLGQYLDHGGLKDADGKLVIIHADFTLENACGKELLVKCLEDGSKYKVFESKLYKAEDKHIVSIMLTACVERFGPQPAEDDTIILVDAPNARDEFDEDDWEQPRWKAKKGRKPVLIEFQEVNSLGLLVLIGLA
ncbi:hypothetical protein CYMTET_29584 [Cymbomonas tetramitiformis]|uniref:Uncharacterized protein n=1 Tax=Cymbomonas tetramitiformis TaxID=36881 RepID=A0AAE0FM57_9CHLO|nr:hypothetical protein CYMTET_29584 [Cymbomonas tetramitiformis]